MTENKVNDLEFEPSVLRNVNLFDEVLSDLKQPPLLENRNFSISSDFRPFPYRFVMEATPERENTVPIDLYFEVDDLRIDLDWIPETFEWSRKQIDASNIDVKKLIRTLFTGFVSIETHGASRFIQIFDANGFFVDALSRNNTIHMITGLHVVRYKSFRRLYSPMFSVPS